MSDPRLVALDLLLASMSAAQARRVLAELGTAAAVRELDRLAAVRRAREMLDARQPRRVIALRLVSAHGMSRRTAYRVIEAALRHGPGGDGTRSGHSAPP